MVRSDSTGGRGRRTAAEAANIPEMAAPARLNVGSWRDRPDALGGVFR
jgi:hypothetical protein